MPRILGIVFAAAFAVAQEAPQPAGGGVGTPAPAPAPSPSPGGNPGGGTQGGGFPQQGTQQPGRQQNDPFGTQQQQQQRFPDMAYRPIFLSGKVVMEDGTPPPESVTIERVCNGVHRPEGYTDSKGRFSFQLGQNSHVMADASTGSDIGGFPGQPGMGGMGGAGNMGGFGGSRGRGINERDLMGCELRAVLAGYRSEVVSLAGRRVMDNPDVGTIIMKPLANVEGKTFSFTSAMAPKDAKKAYEKGIDQLKKKKPAEAQKEFEKAVAAYPKYATAWFELGRVHEFNKQPEEARKAYQQSLAADARFVKPYLQLAQIAIGGQQWQDLADTTDRIIRLNPVDFPQAFFFNSVANYNLRKFDKAEDSAREAVKRDEKHQWPKAQHILGVLLAMKDDAKGAVEHMQGYLKFAPKAGDADMVKKQIEEISKRLSPGETTAQQQ